MRTFRTVAVALVTAVIALVTIVSTQSPNPSQQEQAERQRAERANKAESLQVPAPPPRTIPSQQPPSGNRTPAPPNPSSGWGVNHVIAVLTFVLAWLAAAQLMTHNETLRANKLIERAYVATSPHPPGVLIPGLTYSHGPQNIAHRDIQVRLGVQNLGNTPANITYVLVQMFITNMALPEQPPYDESGLQRIWVSCVKGDDFTVFQNSPCSFEGIEDIQNTASTTTLYVLGYADYIDKFGGRHRTGFARRYNPVPDDVRVYTNQVGWFDETAFNERHNLLFVTQPHYNYDRERKHGEGHDWNEVAQ